MSYHSAEPESWSEYELAYSIFDNAPDDTPRWKLRRMISEAVSRNRGEVFVERLGPDERGHHWVDTVGDEWRPIGKPGQPYEGYGKMWQHDAEGRWMYGDPTPELGPYRRVDF